VIALVAANLLAGWLLYAMLSGEGSALAGDPSGSETLQGTTSPAPTSGKPLGSSVERLDRDLQRRLASAIANAVASANKKTSGKVNGTNCAVSVNVRELGGPERVSIQSDLRLKPASNLKLVTCATALTLLGADWNFTTRFEAAGKVSGGVLAGDLVVRAGGDPLYAADGGGSLDRWLDDLAAQLKQAGVTRVNGALLLDEGDFMDPGPGPAWPSSNDFWQEYCALSAGFSANAGCISARVTPGSSVNARAAAYIRPRGLGLERRGKVTTGKKGSGLDVRVGATAKAFTVGGSIALGTAPYLARFAHPDPVELFGHAVVGGLERRGIQVRGGFRRERHAPGGERVATLRSPLAELLVPILRDSDNSLADQVFLATGHAQGGAGDRAGGMRATRKALDSLGISSAGLEQVDGSGLSKDNRISTRQLSALLAAVLARDARTAALFRDALPVSGESGSLAKRMRSGPAHGRVQAKTGWVNGASGLSGVAQTLDGRTLVFSILVDYRYAAGLNASVWKPMQDRMCELLVESEMSP